MRHNNRETIIANTKSTRTTRMGEREVSEYGELSGNDNPGNDQEAPFGPDYAGVAANVDGSIFAGAGIQASVPETPQGVGTWITRKTVISGTSFELSPSLEFGWKTEAAKNE